MSTGQAPAAGIGGASNQGGQSSGGTGQSAQLNVGPPCTPGGGPALANLPASATIATGTNDMQAVTVNGTDVYYFDHGVGVYRSAYARLRAVRRAQRFLNESHRTIMTPSAVTVRHFNAPA